MSCRVVLCWLLFCFVLFYLVLSRVCSGRVLGDAFPDAFLLPSWVRENNKTDNDLQKNLDRFPAPTHIIAFHVVQCLGKFSGFFFSTMHKHVSQF